MGSSNRENGLTGFDQTVESLDQFGIEDRKELGNHRFFWKWNPFPFLFRSKQREMVDDGVAEVVEEDDQGANCGFFGG